MVLSQFTVACKSKIAHMFFSCMKQASMQLLYHYLVVQIVSLLLFFEVQV